MAVLWEAIYPYVSVLLPTITLALIFWWVMHAIINSDRREREAAAESRNKFESKVQQRMSELEDEERDPHRS